jgi:hypothetical protein
MGTILQFKQAKQPSKKITFGTTPKVTMIANPVISEIVALQLRKNKTQKMYREDEGYSWNYTELKKEDLPVRVQQFIELIKLDTTYLKIIFLESNPSGNYYKILSDGDYKIDASCESPNQRLYICDKITVSAIIRELMRCYLYFNSHSAEAMPKENSYDIQAIGEAFIDHYGHQALTDDAQIRYAQILSCEIRLKNPSVKLRDEEYLPHRHHLTDTLGEEYFIKSYWEEIVCEIVATYGRKGQFDKIEELFAEHGGFKETELPYASFLATSQIKELVSMGKGMSVEEVEEWNRTQII